MKNLLFLSLAAVTLFLVSLACGLLGGAPTEEPEDPPADPVIITPTTPAESPTDPFVGVWVSTDVDGSTQTLNITGADGVYTFEYFDDGASVCGLDNAGNFLFAASASGTLTASGDTLSGNFSITCLDSPPFHGIDHVFVFTYDPAGDTLTDDLGVVWHR